MLRNPPTDRFHTRLPFERQPFSDTIEVSAGHAAGFSDHIALGRGTGIMKEDDYRTTARYYDLLISPFLRQLRLDINTFITHKAYRRVIDFCCGTGEQLRLLASDAMHLEGVDRSAAMIEEARKKSPPDISFRQLDAQSGTVADESFDCAVISMALHEMHTATRESVYSRVRRSVRQGGSVIVADYDTPPATMAARFTGTLVIPVVERLAGSEHYAHYRDWMNRGGLEGFLANRRERADIISRRLGGTALVCAVLVDDEARSFRTSLALLNRSLADLDSRAGEKDAGT